MPVSRGGREMQGSGADGGKKHTIDSDEEEEMNNAYNTVADHDKMKEDDIEGKQLSHFQPLHLKQGGLGPARLHSDSVFTSRKAGQHVLQVEGQGGQGQGGGVESFSFLEKNYEKIIRKKLK